MPNTFRNYTIKNILGTIDESYLKTYITLSKNLQKVYSLLDRNLSQEPYLLANYNVYQQMYLMIDLLQKHKYKNKITAFNNHGLLVVLDSVNGISWRGKGTRQDVLINCHFKHNGKGFCAFLPTLLSEDFTGWSVNINFTVADKLQSLEMQLEALQRKISDANKKIDKEFFEALKAKPWLVQEAFTNKTHATPRNKRKKSDNTILTPAEEKILMAWISKYIHAIHLYCVKDGQSEYALQQAGIDPENYHARDPKYNERGQCTSKDIISGEVDFKITRNAPLDILRKACNIAEGDVFKISEKSGFARLCSTEFAKYLIIKYGKYGFRGQKTNLFTHIHHAALCKDLGIDIEYLKSI